MEPDSQSDLATCLLRLEIEFTTIREMMEKWWTEKFCALVTRYPFFGAWDGNGHVGRCKDGTIPSADDAVGMNREDIHTPQGAILRSLANAADLQLVNTKIYTASAAKATYHSKTGETGPDYLLTFDQPGQAVQPGHGARPLCPFGQLLPRVEAHHQRCPFWTFIHNAE